MTPSILECITLFLNKMYTVGMQKYPLYINQLFGDEQDIYAIDGIPKLQTIITSYEPSGNNLLDAGERASFSIRFINSGKGHAINIITNIIIQNENVEAHIKMSTPKIVTSIAPGKEKILKIPLEVEKTMPTGEIVFFFFFLKNKMDFHQTQ